MPKVLTEARSICPELTDAVKALDKLAYKRDYAEVFSDLVDWLVYEHTMPPIEANPLEKKYDEKEQSLFLEAYKNIREEVVKRVNLWTAKGDPQKYKSDGWYDPIGRIYEVITNTHKSKQLGQYFTPTPIVNMMVQMTAPGEMLPFERILDPACGSGRMGLAAATYATSMGTPTWVTMNDLDPILSKVTAINMCLNGIVGEATNMNGLDVEGHTYRFGYRVEPALASVPQEIWEYFRMLVFAKTGQDIKKQYVLKPISYEQTFLKQANDRLYEDFKQRQQIADQEEREKAVQEFKDKIKDRLSGTLFEDDETLIENLEPPPKKPKVIGVSLKKRQPPNEDAGEQGTLF